MKMLCKEIKINGIKIDSNAIYIKNESDTIYKQKTISGFSGYVSDTGFFQLIPNKDFTLIDLKKDDIIEITDNMDIVRECKIIKVEPFNCFTF
jgi:hypothetical protein